MTPSMVAHSVLAGRKEQRAQRPHPMGQTWQRQEGQKAERIPAA